MHIETKQSYMRIKEILKEKGMTQQELADKVGVSYQSMKQTLNASSVTTATLGKIAEALNVQMWELFASIDDISGGSEETAITCPHCGKRIQIGVK